MQAVDVMVHPSIDPEPFGRTLVEAMLIGVPVVATEAGAAPDILEHGRAGSLVPPGDPSALARAIDAALSGGAGLQSQLEHAKRRALSEYSLRRMLDGVGLLITTVQRKAVA
jgi:glycosyltransferase involved in cell wall biosynthesis